MKKILFIINPVAGRKHAGSSMYNVVKRFCDSGYTVTIAVTQYKGHGKELAKSAADEGYDLVVCTGGDGTLNEVASGLVEGGSRIPFGYLPAGSTNDFARTLGISTIPLKATEHIIKEQPKTLDMGSFNDGAQHFVYIASFGAFTEVSYGASQSAKNKFGHLAYLYEGVKDMRNLRAYNTTVTADGGRVYKGRYIFGSVTNTRSIAGLITLYDKKVDLNDGMFEVMLIKEPKDPIDFSNIIVGLTTTVQGNEMFEYFRASELTFQMPKTAPWTVDGEEAKHESGVIHIQNMKEALTIYK
ncbi:MAG: diacylglycerol kinase family lipid kinase [Clostridia bacterium]|nr:diacylglycerol kinase family lipid kinase [Clostridia bacterium]